MLKRFVIYCCFFAFNQIMQASLPSKKLSLGDIPSELYQEMVVNADTLADAARGFLNLRNTSRKYKEALDKNMGRIVTQLAQKFAVDPLLAAFYIGAQQAKKLYPKRYADTKLLSNLLETVLKTEKNIYFLKMMIERLVDSGAYLRRFDTHKLADGRYILRYDDAIVLLFPDPKAGTKGLYSRFPLFEQSPLNDYMKSHGLYIKTMSKKDSGGFILILGKNVPYGDQYRDGYDEQIRIVEIDDNFKLVSGITIPEFPLPFSTDLLTFSSVFEHVNADSYSTVVLLRKDDEADHYFLIVIPKNSEQDGILMRLQFKGDDPFRAFIRWFFLNPGDLEKEKSLNPNSYV